MLQFLELQHNRVEVSRRSTSSGFAARTPTGAYVAKKLLLDSAGASGQWRWDPVMLVGGLLTAAYVVLVLAHALARARAPLRLKSPASRQGELRALALALCSLLLGVGATDAGLPDAFSAKQLGSAALFVLGGPVLAAGLGLRLPPISVGKTFAALAAALWPARRRSCVPTARCGSGRWQGCGWSCWRPLSARPLSDPGLQRYRNRVRNRGPDGLKRL